MLQGYFVSFCDSYSFNISFQAATELYGDVGNFGNHSSGLSDLGGLRQWQKVSRLLCNGITSNINYHLVIQLLHECPYSTRIY